MTRPEDEELLHRALDRALTAEETERLRARLAADPELRARADRLERLAALVDEPEPLRPPAMFTDRVMTAVEAVPPARQAWSQRAVSAARMIGHQLFHGFAHHSGQSARHPESFRKAGMAGGGVIVAKKALWGIAGLAVIVILVVVYFNGTRSVDQGAQGTIGAADRYRGAQPSSVSAKTGDAEAFLQSDTFNQMMKSKEVRSLLSNGDFCELLTRPEVALAVTDANVQSALDQMNAEAALAGPQVQAVFRDAHAMAVFKDLTVVNALRSEQANLAFASAKVHAALTDKTARDLLTDRSVMSALQHPNVRAQILGQAERAMQGHQASLGAQNALTDKQRSMINMALNSKLVASALTDRAFQRSLDSNLMQNLWANIDFVQSLQGPMLDLISHPAALNATMRVFSNLTVNRAIQQNLRVTMMLAHPDAAIAFKNLAFARALGNSRSGFQDALANQRALQARLRSYQQQ